VSEASDDPRALRLMVDELRAEPAPDLDWDRIERGLMSAIDRSESARAVRLAAVPRSRFAQVAMFAAAAGFLALGIGSMAGQRAPETVAAIPHVVDVEQVATAPGEPGEHDLGALAAGDVVEAGDAPVVFGRAGDVVWTLAPGSRARMLSMGSDKGEGHRSGTLAPPAERGEAAPGRDGAASGPKPQVGHTVALERGSLHAEVVPRDLSAGMVEAFAVEVEGTRIAVHGTSFTVVRGEGQVLVDVEHGTIAVGPAGHQGATTGHLLIGPSRASFSLDGGRTAQLLPRTSAVAPSAVAVLAPVGQAPSRPLEPAGLPAAVVGMGLPAAGGVAEVSPVVRPTAPPSARVAAAEEPKAPPVEVAEVTAPPPPEPRWLTVDSVRAHLGRCFLETYTTDGSPSVQISVASTLRIQLRPDGSVQTARFDPPLKPEFQTCAGGAIAGRFAEGGREVDIPVAFGR
jgi:hypothetical protein